MCNPHSFVRIVACFGGCWWISHPSSPRIGLTSIQVVGVTLSHPSSPEIGLTSIEVVGVTLSHPLLLGSISLARLFNPFLQYVQLGIVLLASRGTVFEPDIFTVVPHMFYIYGHHSLTSIVHIFQTYKKQLSP